MDGLVLVKGPAGGTAVLTRRDTQAVKVSDSRRTQLVMGGFRGVPGRPGVDGDTHQMLPYRCQLRYPRQVVTRRSGRVSGLSRIKA